VATRGHWWQPASVAADLAQPDPHHFYPHEFSITRINMQIAKVPTTPVNTQATIYVTQETYDTAMMIKDLDHHDRANLCDDLPDLANQPGYHLKNANKLKLAVLPDDANIVLHLNQINTPQVLMPSNLRGCIFEMAPNLPDGYADIVAYWSGQTINSNTSGAVYFQNQQNEYMVDLGADPVGAPVINDRLLSEGVVVAITCLDQFLTGLSPDHFVEINFPIDVAMLGIEPDDFRSTGEYSAASEDTGQVFLKVADILASPNPDCIYIDLLCNELIDYGYWY
jgi:hypothetical protein